MIMDVYNRKLVSVLVDVKTLPFLLLAIPSLVSHNVQSALMLMLLNSVYPVTVCVFQEQDVLVPVII